ncbi:MAG: nitrate- and nitrite sensing domain-containing protein [Marinospirillum sp.]|uniref:nitrate- and nitrite sensing domain-containing protein n=1 Tax=Marinospirillum sp. TaxID=2183934 RepID=UPI0019E4987E|nr:nitrate- and nitrite sensing domain-containing protein [Marinospirillum sp.]MBE0506844.1 nitrate- and nitrite sensing domain-containing protein [Marinospirillum sp.]
MMHPVSYALIVLAVFLLLLLLQHRHHKQLKQQRQDYLAQLLVLRQLIGGFQRHRGLSNGVLCGDVSLRDQLSHTRRELDQLLNKALLLPTRHSNGWQALADHWSRLGQGRTLDAKNNLQQHHLLIRNSIFLFEDLALAADLSNNRKDLYWLPVIWREVLQTAEWAGQARALGTGMAATRHSSPEQRIRMKFLYHKIRLLSEMAFSDLQPGFPNQSPQAAGLLNICQQQVQQLLTCINDQLLLNSQINISAPDYFRQASETIDALLALVDITLHDLQQES